MKAENVAASLSSFSLMVMAGVDPRRGERETNNCVYYGESGARIIYLKSSGSRVSMERGGLKKLIPGRKNFLSLFFYLIITLKNLIRKNNSINLWN